MKQQLVIPRAWRLARATSIDDNPANVISRAGTFAASTPDGTVLVTRREADGLAHYMFVPETSRVGDAAANLAQALGARLEALDSAPDAFQSRHMVVAQHRHGSAVGRETQAGVELGEVSLRLATILKEGEWVAAVIRRPAEREKRWHNQWLSFQTGGRVQHHSTTTTAVIMSLWAGSQTVGMARDILYQVAAALPGFDLKIDAVPVTTVRKGVAVILTGIAVSALAVLALRSHVADASPAAQHVLGFLLGLGAPLVLGGALYIARRLPSYAEKVKRFARFNRLLFPVARRFWWSKPKRERSGKDGALIPATDGSYPLDRRAFLTGPHLPASLVAPQAGAASGTASTQHRIAPAVMTENIGPIIGDNNGVPVHLSAADGWSGTALFGAAGSGKTRLVQSLFAWSSLERKHPSMRAGFPGRQNALVAFESKGDGAEAYIEWGRLAGDTVFRIDLAGGSDGIQLDFLTIPGNAEKKARALVNALKYAFSDGSIQERSFDTLVQVFCAAFAVTPAVAELAGVSGSGSPFYYANILLGGRGDPLGVGLAGAIKSEVARLALGPGDDLAGAAEKLEALYEGKTPSQRATLTDAPRNKVSALLAAESWWSRQKKLTWDMVLQHNMAVVVNTGISLTGQQEDDQLVAQVSAIMMYTLYEAIKRNCSTWFEEGRAVSIFADELKLLAGSSATVITWLRDQGRSYGVRPVFATQYPEQLTQEVRNSVMGFGTLLAFSQNNPTVVQTLVGDLSLSGDEWTGADIANLPAFETIVRANVHRQRMTPFTVKIRDFWGQRDSYAAQQGYGE